jgi:hypothetical protein
MQDFEVGQQAVPTDLGLLQRLVDDVRVLVLSGRREPTDAEFDGHVAEAMAMAPSVRAVLVIILMTEGGAPSPERRSKLARARLLDVPTAVMTSSIRIRGMLTPINWLGGNVKPFALHQFEEACDYLTVPRGTRERLRDQMMAMRAELAGDAPGGDRASRSGTFAAVKRAVAAGFAIVRKKHGGEGGRHS